MTKISLKRLEQAIAELEALQALADKLAEALELADCAFCGANMDMSVVEKRIRAALAEYQAHKEGS